MTITSALPAIKAKLDQSILQALEEFPNTRENQLALAAILMSKADAIFSIVLGEKGGRIVVGKSRRIISFLWFSVGFLAASFFAYL